MESKIVIIKQGNKTLQKLRGGRVTVRFKSDRDYNRKNKDWKKES